jgi:hypothetical protein
VLNPPRVVLVRIGIDGFVHAPVNREVRLSIAREIKCLRLHLTLNRRLEDRGGDSLPEPFILLWLANVDGEKLHPESSEYVRN